jgi:hypothetical protein
LDFKATQSDLECGRERGKAKGNREEEEGSNQLISGEKKRHR